MTARDETSGATALAGRHGGTATGRRGWLRRARAALRDPGRRREILALAATGLVGLAILGAGTLAIVVTRGDPGETTPNAECVRWKVNTARPVLLRTEITGATTSGARCGDTLLVARIGRDGPFRVVVGEDVLWTSRCADARNPSALDLEVGPEGDLLASVRCPAASPSTDEPAPVVEVDLDQLLRDEGYPPFLQY